MAERLLSKKELDDALRACLVAAPRWHHIASIRLHIETLTRKLREARRTISKLKRSK